AAAESSAAVKSAELFVDSFDQAPRDLRLVLLRPVLDAIGGDRVHPVAMAPHHVSGHVVGDDPVGTLGLALGDCLLDHALRLGGKAGDRKSLAAGRAVGDHPDGVDRLVRRSGSDEDVLAGERHFSRSVSWSMISCGSGRRPGPNSPHAISPSAGSITRTPSALSW